MVYMMTNKDLISLLLTGTMLFSFSLVLFFAYDGELTSEVCTAIIEAFKKSRFMGKAQSGYGALRWSNGDTIIGVDRVKRQLILGSSMSLCD